MASSGPLSPGTLADETSVGTVAWTNPGNAAASDNSRASVSLAVPGSISHYLKATNFGFAIPSGATIDGIVVEVECARSTGAKSSGTCADSKARIVKGGVIGATDKANATAWASADTYLTHGSSSDKWGETWTDTDINSSTFGFVISAKSTAAKATAIPLVDHIRITVYYTAGGGGGGGGGIHPPFLRQQQVEIDSQAPDQSISKGWLEGPSTPPVVVIEHIPWQRKLAAVFDPGEVLLAPVRLFPQPQPVAVVVDPLAWRRKVIAGFDPVDSFLIPTRLVPQPQPAVVVDPLAWQRVVDVPAESPAQFQQQSQWLSPQGINNDPLAWQRTLDVLSEAVPIPFNERLAWPDFQGKDNSTTVWRKLSLLMEELRIDSSVDSGRLGFIGINNDPLAWQKVAEPVFEEAKSLSLEIKGWLDSLGIYGQMFFTRRTYGTEEPRPEVAFLRGAWLNPLGINNDSLAWRTETANQLSETQAIIPLDAKWLDALGINHDLLAWQKPQQDRLDDVPKPQELAKWLDTTQGIRSDSPVWVKLWKSDPQESVTTQKTGGLSWQVTQFQPFIWSRASVAFESPPTEATTTRQLDWLQTRIIETLSWHRPQPVDFPITALQPQFHWVPFFSGTSPTIQGDLFLTWAVPTVSLQWQSDWVDVFLTWTMSVIGLQWESTLTVVNLTWELPDRQLHWGPWR